MAEHLAAPFQVLLIASHNIVLFGLEQLIESHDRKMEVVGKFTHYSKVFPELERLSPDVIVIDLDQEPMDGVDAIRDLVRLYGARIVVFSALDDQATCNQAVLAGARGLIGKKEPLETILKAIEKVHEGQLGWTEPIWANLSTISPIREP